MDVCRLFFDDECGATAVEYGLIAALTTVVALVSFGLFGAAVGGKFLYIQDAVGAVGAPAPTPP